MHTGSKKIPVTDPGLQPERTALSWGRTALAMLVCSSVLLRWSSAYPGIIFTVVVLLAALAVIIIVLNRRVYRHEAVHLANEHSAPNTAAVVAMTLAMCVLGGMGLYVVIVA